MKLRAIDLRDAIVAEIGALSSDAVQAIAREIENSSGAQLRAYLCGAMHDGTWSTSHRTIRIAQSSLAWVWGIESVFRALESRSWCYQEGTRDVFVVESSFKLERRPFAEDPDSRAAYLRGYFDAEGGTPHDAESRFYIQFVQRDRADLKAAKEWLESLSIRTGRMHNPSHRVDPNYWRFYVRSDSHMSFARLVRSWHPRKRMRLENILGRGATAGG